MKYIDLFAGIGGFRYGLEKAKKRYTCVWSNEWDKYATKVYKRHYGRINTQDIRTVDASEIPDHDLLCAGFPCQSFSVAGKRKGFEDTRGTLFFEIARIAKHKRPRYLLLENVKGLLSHQEGKTFQTILGVLSDLGYRVEWQVLNSKHFGVPQNRERVFIIGHLGGQPRPKVFPIGESNSVFDKTKQRKQKGGERISSTIDSRYGALRNSGETYVSRIPLRYLNRNQKNIKGDYAFTVDGSNTSGIKQGMKIRRLTPTECARLQGFPDDWCADLSDTQAYKCYGNAVTTNVITAIGGALEELNE